jgi:hypothetical protein
VFILVYIPAAESWLTAALANDSEGNQCDQTDLLEILANKNGLPKFINDVLHKFLLKTESGYFPLEFVIS